MRQPSEVFHFACWETRLQTTTSGSTALSDFRINLRTSKYVKPWSGAHSRSQIMSAVFAENRLQTSSFHLSKKKCQNISHRCRLVRSFMPQSCWHSTRQAKQCPCPVAPETRDSDVQKLDTQQVPNNAFTKLDSDWLCNDFWICCITSGPV